MDGKSEQLKFIHDSACHCFLKNGETFPNDVGCEVTPCLNHSHAACRRLQNVASCCNTCPCYNMQSFSIFGYLKCGLQKLVLSHNKSSFVSYAINSVGTC